MANCARKVSPTGVNYPTSENVIGSPFPDDALKEFVMAAVASATQG